jgi:TIR domain
VPINCFLSHSHHDKPFADRLADTLAAHGVETWYSARQIMAADQWHDEIGKALERCDWFLLILSTSAVNSRWVKRELSHRSPAEAGSARCIRAKAVVSFQRRPARSSCGQHERDEAIKLLRGGPEGVAEWNRQRMPTCAALTFGTRICVMRTSVIPGSAEPIALGQTFSSPVL